MEKRKRWFVVVVYAAAMAWVESAVVYDLRTMVDRIVPYQQNPLPVIGGLGQAELVREVATMVMLLAIGGLAGRSWRSRLGYTAVAFGVWDILYYVFLRVLCGWPHSLFDWDVLFLIPLPWWGPVLAPMLIALLMIAWGTLASQFDEPRPPEPFHWWSRALSFLGVGLALYTFMADTIPAARHGVEVVRQVLPARFDWLPFCFALGLMSAPLVRMCWRLLPQHSPSLTNVETA